MEKALIGLFFLLIALLTINKFYHFALKSMDENQQKNIHTQNKKDKEISYQARYKKVEETSLKYKSLVEYNARWPIETAPLELVYKFPYASRPEAEIVAFDGLLEKTIREHYEEIMSALQEIGKRKRQYQLYLDQMQSNLWVTPESFIEETGIEASEYRRIENRLCEKKTIRTRAELNITIKKTYKSSEQHTRAIIKRFEYEEIKTALYDEWRRRVIYYSDRIAKISAINDEYRKLFVDVKAQYTYQKNCASYDEFKRYDNSDRFMKEILQDKAAQFWLAYDGAKRNKKYYDQYLQMVSSVKPTIQQNVIASGMPEQIFYGIEQDVAGKMKLIQPTLSISRGVRVLYFSTKRNNRHEFKRNYSSEELISLLEELKKAEAYQAQRNDERSKMTNSLRYDIMKRDGFRCVLCGASAASGATLHVDHIIPVSKGGKTVKSNLRTLCDRCNTGKRDKFDPNGLN